MVNSALERLAGEHCEIIFLKVNVDKFEEVMTEYNVTILPSVKFMKSGKIVAEIDSAGETVISRMRSRFINH
ncbi:thioredoxin-like protein [Leptotrombidium deliense]|uniref:Thioredoxin-like protein n=1 Tax=Leptotrombidium deliense TaxID=299467 RepID=A0A443S9W9_9ACAR|nr:thioredoxin-like protein [Leptotrombidium deliense]